MCIAEESSNIASIARIWYVNTKEESDDMFSLAEEQEVQRNKVVRKLGAEMNHTSVKKKSFLLL